MREYGHQLLDNRKERRRYSLLSMRKFTGDYLDIKNGTGAVSMIRGAISFGANEEVIFSMRGQTLVARAMRSSVPSPRTLVMVRLCSKVGVTCNSSPLIYLDQPSYTHCHDNQKGTSSLDGG
jgi:myosin-1